MTKIDLRRGDFEGMHPKAKLFGFDENKKLYIGDGVESINDQWTTWCACIGMLCLDGKEAQAVPEGFVVVPKDKISHFYQDNDEPENFCNSSDDWDCLGDGIDKDQIMIVNKHTQANISTEKFYGAWKLIETSYGTRWKFELFKSESEAKQAMIDEVSK